MKDTSCQGTLLSSIDESVVRLDGPDVKSDA